MKRNKNQIIILITKWKHEILSTDLKAVKFRNIHAWLELFVFNLFSSSFVIFLPHKKQLYKSAKAMHHTIHTKYIVELFERAQNTHHIQIDNCLPRNPINIVINWHKLKFIELLRFSKRNGKFSSGTVTGIKKLHEQTKPRMCVSGNVVYSGRKT